MSTEQQESISGGKMIFTTGEAAELCKVSQQTIIRCFDSGRLGGFRVPGSRFRRIPKAELIKFMRTNGMDTNVLDAQPRRVLIIDDDPTTTDMLKATLVRNAAIEVYAAANAFEAGLLCGTLQPDLVILDALLPAMTGDAAALALGSSRVTAGTRVLILEEAGSQIAHSGNPAVEAMRKPLDLGALMARINVLLEM